MRKILNEQLDITDAHPLKARFYDYKNFTYPWHFHSEFEVIYIEKGYGLGMAGDGMTDFSDQQLFLLGSNLPHYLENSPEYNLKEELRVNGVIIQFEKDFMQYAFSHYSQFQGINRLLEDAQRGLLFSLSNCTNDIPQIIKRIPQKEGVGQIVELLQSVRRERILSVQVMMIFAVLSPEKFLVGKHCGSAVHAYPKKRLMRVTSDTALFSPSSVSLKSWRPILAWLTVSGSNTVTCSPGWPNA